MKESDLFLPVKEFLLENGCSDVYGEVLNFDVLGITGASNIIVELKSSLSFKLLDQAIDRLNYGHYVYIAIPKRKDYIPRSIKEFLQYKKIGVLEVEKSLRFPDGIVNVSIPARFNHRATQMHKRGLNKIREHIKPYNEAQIGGVKGGESVTDYSLMIDNIKDFMRIRKRGKWVTVEEILEHCEVYYANPKPSLMATLQANWNQPWCETKLENRKKYFRFKQI